MRTRYFSLVFGLIFLIVGILGFVPSLMTPPAPQGPAMAVGSYYGYLFGLFPVNALHNLVHILIGLWGIAAWRTFAASRVFARGLAIIYIVLAVFGLIPGLNTLFGLVPLYSHDIWLHAVTAVIAAYFGWAAVPAVTTAQEPTPGVRR
jgi:hypothetical protein